MDETIGLCSRLGRLQVTLRFIDEPLAVTLLKGVIEHETQIAAVESARQPWDDEVVKTNTIRQEATTFNRKVLHRSRKVSCR